MLYEVITVINQFFKCGAEVFYQAVRDVEFLRANTDRMIKMTVPGPRITSYNVCYTKLLRSSMR